MHFWSFLSKTPYLFIDFDKTPYYGCKKVHFWNQIHKNTNEIDLFLKNFTPYDAIAIEASLPEPYGNIPHQCYYEIPGLNNESNWVHESYNRCNLYPEKLIHTTVNGMKVRSKSEAIIADMLYMNEVPYRYEAELILNESKYYPDFTILNPRNGKIIYWEHFGMTECSRYAMTMEQKLKSYMKHGVTIWNNLITTFDHDNGSINTQDINNIIKAFLV